MSWSAEKHKQFVGYLFDLTKEAVSKREEADQRLQESDQKRKELEDRLDKNQGPEKISATQAFTWVEKLDNIGLLPRDTDKVKMASTIQEKPEFLVDRLIELQEPMQAEGEAVEKYASHKPKELYDDCGWLSAIS